MLVLLISNVWTQFLKFWCCLVKTIPRTPHGWMLLLDFAKATTDGDTCRTPCAGWGSAPHMSPWPCWWPRDTNSSSQEMPGSPHYCTSQAGLTNTGEYAGTPVRIFPPISSILTKAGGKRSLSNGFFFCFILLPPSLPPVIWFFTPHLCVFIQLIFVFSFFFTPLDQLSPLVWHLWLYPSASQCRLAEQHLITGRIWLTGALIMVVGKAQSLPFQQYTLCRKRSTVSQSDKKKNPRFHP